MKRLAIVGTGIAGLAAAHFLKDRYELTLFEQNDYAGGHTHTVDVPEDGRLLPIDTGFMVFNPVTYPYLTRFFQELQVPTQTTDMSFSVQNLPLGLEWNGAGLDRLFGQRRNLWNPRFWKMLLQLDRFNREAVRNVDDPRYEGMSIAEYVAERGYGPDLLSLYLVPMSSAIWSTSPQTMLAFPARTLLRFFFNHGFLGLHTHHQWYTVTGGARTYVEKMKPPFAQGIRLNSPVTQVSQTPEGPVAVTCRPVGRPEAETALFDRVILACHADQALRLLSDPTEAERRLLGAFPYEQNRALLHTDTAIMPKTRRCWGAWNYRVRDAGGPGATGLSGYQASTHYWMNRLQAIPETRQYFVSINADAEIDPAKVIRTLDYEHPTYTVAAIQAQKSLSRLNARHAERPIYFCGSYFQYGFHEDAFASALDLAREITGEATLWR